MSTIIHAIIGYFFLLFAVRVLSRRPGAQLTIFEFVIVFLIGGVIILSTVGNDHSITNCSCAVIAVGFMHRVVSWAKQRSARFAKIVDGTPLLLLKHGVWQEEVMQGMHLAPEDVMAAARSKGVRDTDSIGYAILERNGAISIIKAEEQ